MRLCLLLLLAIAACRPDPRSGDDLFAAARDAAEAVEPDEAVRLYQKAAAKGSVDALFNLFRIYRYGVVHNRDEWAVGTVGRDSARAYRYRQTALDTLLARAERGDVDAWAQWVMATWDDRPRPQSWAEIAEADRRGSALAKGVGAMAAYHHDAPPALDSLFYTQAREAAEAGDPLGQSLLALAYRQGKGTPVDSVRYRYWLEQAALSGDEPARRELAALEMAR